MMKKMMKGFTLAEVLTTLLVIGVVAALTIPALFNNTGERQYKAQYKKAVAVLEQAISLINTDSKCNISNSADLAKCFNKEMKGNLTSYNGENSGSNKNVIVSPDGAAYQFMYNVMDSATSLKDACGTFPARNNNPGYYNGAAAKCKVIIDLNGLDKGTTEFPSTASTYISDAYDSDALDQQVINIYSNGILPAYVYDNNNINRGYTWMYGDNAPF